MRRICFVMCCVFLLGLLIPGVISLVDKDPSVSQVADRPLKTFPEFTFCAVLDGSFLDDLKAYYTDTFPGREALAEDYAGLSWLIDPGKDVELKTDTP